MSTEALMIHILTELVVIVAFARLGGIAFKAIGQPVVCGEIAAGLILGPSLLGGLFPGLSAEVFSEETNEVFTVLSQLGLIFLLFLIGIDFEYKHLNAHKGKPLAISAVGITIPFGLGFLLGLWMHSTVDPSVPKYTFALFIGMAMSITALPILGRILIEFGLNKTPLGVLTITSAALDDAIGWTLLAFIIGISKSHTDVGRAFLMAGEAIAYALFLFVVARPYLMRWTKAAIRRGQGTIQQTDFALLIVLLLLSAYITNQIGIFSIFGAFMFGAALAGDEEFRDAVLARLSDFVTVFFLPIFFTYTGLRTDIGSMSGLALWGFCALVIVTGIVGKLGGCTLAARATGLPWRDASMVGVMMNTRALMALIVVNVGLEAGILNKSAFFMLVAMAVVTTYMTAPLLRRLLAQAPADSLAQVPRASRSAGGGDLIPEAAMPAAGSAVT